MAATLQISRGSDSDLKIRGIEVLLDGEFLREFKFGDEYDVEIKPGRHTLKATNRLKSATVDFEIADGERVEFETIGIALGGIWVLISMLGTVAYRVKLERV